MEHVPSLRSLEATGRPSGTGRSTSSSDTRRDARFEDALHTSDRRTRQAAEERHTAEVRSDARRADGAKHERIANPRNRSNRVQSPDPRDETPKDDAAKNSTDAKATASDAASKKDDQTAAHDANAASPNHANADSADETHRSGAARGTRAASTAPDESGAASTETTKEASAQALQLLALGRQLDPHSAARAAAVATDHSQPSGDPSTLPVSATGESDEVEPAETRPAANVEHTALASDEGRAKFSVELPTANDNAATAQVAPREIAAAKVDAPAPKHAPAPAAEAHAPEILRQLRLTLSSSMREATLQLEPEHLGRISIKLAVEHGKVSAEVRAERADTLAVLQHHGPELHAMLESRGVTPDHVGFELGLGRGSNAHTAPGGDQRPNRRNDDGATESLTRRAARELRAIASSVWGVDTYA